MLGFALVAHLTSTADALRQPHFPALGERADRALVFWCLLGGLYAPTLGFAAVTAWPGAVLNLDGEGYLVNLWAFRAAEPEIGAHVWFRPTRLSDPRLGRVVGCPGQQVDWADGWIRSDGRKVSRNFPGITGETLRALSFRIPDGHLLVRPVPRRPRDDPGPLLVEQDGVIGRAWAQSYPVRRRHLLH